MNRMHNNSGLYIHLPFCKTKCPYCAFYTLTGVNDSVIDKYLEACLKEVNTIKDIVFDTIYIGGGTPSFIGDIKLISFIEKLLSKITYTGKEFTIEVNPESVTKTLCIELGKTKVNRVSMGIQSLNNEVLKILGRPHNSDTAINALSLFERYNPDAILSIDLIYDIPGVEYNTVAESAKTIFQHNVKHISAYSYMPDTGYLTDKPSEDPIQMELTTELMFQHSFYQYEISNYSKKGFESIHNKSYWQMKPYYGVGASAHSMQGYSKHARYNHLSDIHHYIEHPTDKNDYEEYDEITSLKEYLVFGLRMTEGVDMDAAAKRYGIFPEKLIQNIRTLIDKGFIIKNNSNICLSEKGLLVTESIMSYLW